MTKDERAIIDKFLSQNELITRFGENKEVKSVADVEAYQEKRETNGRRNKVFRDLVKEYRPKIDKGFCLWNIERAAKRMAYTEPYPYRYLDEYPPEEFNRLVRVSRAILDALAKEFPAESEEKGA